MRHASVASMRLPVSARYFTWLAPISAASRCVPDQPGQVAMVASGSPKPRRRDGDTNVGDRGQFKSAAERVTVDRGDHRHAQPRPLVENLVAAPDPATPHVERFQRRPGIDVGTDAERLVAGGGQDDAADSGVGVDPRGDVRERLDHFRCQRIELVRAIQNDGCDRAVDLQLDLACCGSGMSGLPELQI